MTNIKRLLRRTWHFIWEEDSILSWIVNIILAFVIIKFLVYPGLGLALGTSQPIVAVISGSMEHGNSFDSWWETQQSFYSQQNITKAQFKSFIMSNGFNKGDVIVLGRAGPANLKVGEVVVYKSRRPDPIIHRIVYKWKEGDSYYFKTKGDHNYYFITDLTLDETRVPEDQLIGKALFKVPLVGYVKIGFVSLINVFTGGSR